MKIEVDGTLRVWIVQPDPAVPKWMVKEEIEFSLKRGRVEYSSKRESIIARDVTLAEAESIRDAALANPKREIEVDDDGGFFP